MQAIARRLLGATSVMVLAAACGAQPNQPVLANVPRPNPAAVAGGAAAAAAAITLADPDAATRKPEKREETEKKPIKVKENVPASVLDRLDQAEANQPANGVSDSAADASSDSADDGNAKQRAKPARDAKQPTKPANLKLPRDPLDFSE